MKKSFFFLLALLPAFSLATELWTAGQEGRTYYYGAFNIAIDDEGNTYVNYSAFSNPPDFSTSSDYADILGYEDFYLEKYDSAGRKLWSRTWGTYGKDSASQAAVTPDGSAVYVCGASPIADDGNVSDETELSALGVRNSIAPKLFKFDSSGEMLWERILGQIGNFRSCGILRVNDQDDVYIRGYPHDGKPQDFIPEEGPDIGIPFLSKYDSNGSEVWSVPLAKKSFIDFSLDHEGLPCVFGYDYSSDVQAGFLSKYEANGTEAWTTTYTVDESNTMFEYLTSDSASNLYLARTTENIGSDGTVAKYSTTGEVQWDFDIGVKIDDGVFGISMMPDDTVVIGVAALCDENGEIAAQSDDESNLQECTCFLHYDTHAGLLQKQCIQPKGKQLQMATDPNGTIYLAGLTVVTFYTVQKPNGYFLTKISWDDNETEGTFADWRLLGAVEAVPDPKEAHYGAKVIWSYDGEWHKNPDIVEAGKGYWLKR